MAQKNVKQNTKNVQKWLKKGVKFVKSQKSATCFHNLSLALHTENQSVGCKIADLQIFEPKTYEAIL